MDMPWTPYPSVKAENFTWTSANYWAHCNALLQFVHFNQIFLFFQSPSALSHPRWTSFTSKISTPSENSVCKVDYWHLDCPPDLIIPSELSSLLVIQKTSQITKQSQGWCIISWTWLHLRIKQPNLNELQPKIRESDLTRNAFFGLTQGEEWKV